jgi:hypothetical protein
MKTRSYLQNRHKKRLVYYYLQVAQGVTLRLPDIFPDIDPECHKKVDDHGRSHGEAGGINEVFPDGGTGYAHFLPQPGTNPENMAFYKLPEPVHSSNLHKFSVGNSSLFC